MRKTECRRQSHPYRDPQKNDSDAQGGSVKQTEGETSVARLFAIRFDSFRNHGGDERLAHVQALVHKGNEVELDCSNRPR